MRTVLSILASSGAEALRILEHHRDEVDLVELRADRLRREEVSAFLARAERETIVTAIPRASFGEYDGTVEQRLELALHAARAGARWVDLDAAIADRAPALPMGSELLVSHHDLRPGLHEDPAERVRSLRARFPGRALKLVYTLARAEEAGALYRALAAETRRDPAPLCLFAMGGEAARPTRVLAGVFGSAFSYLAPDPEIHAVASAPGQWSVTDWSRTVGPRMPGATTAIYGLVGRGTRLSLSPAVHGAAFRAAGRDALFLRFEPEEVRAFWAAHELPAFRGFSVTQPFKEEAWLRADTRSAAAEAMRAANTLVRRGERWHAANTDAPAVVEALHAAGARCAGASALVLGAGGAARAAAVALRGAGADVVVAARRPEACAEFAAEQGLGFVAWDRRASVPATIVVQATPMGSPSGEGGVGTAPLEVASIAPGAHVLDLVYRPRETELLRRARRAGAVAVEGLSMFLAQARLQHVEFTGWEPPAELLREAAERELARQGEPTARGGSA